MQSGRILLYIKKTPKEEGITAGLIIPKKEAPLAVERNYIKRVIYAFLADKEKEGMNGAKVVIRLAGKRPFKKREVSLEIRKELQKVLQKAGLTQ